MQAFGWITLSLFTVLLASCLSVTYAPGAPCGTDGWCPPEQFCELKTRQCLPSIAVRGTAYGVLQPVGLRMQYGESSEMLNIASDGPFEFPAQVQVGDVYTVEIIDQSPCVLTEASGVVTGAGPVLSLACEGVFLQSLAISGLITLDLEFEQMTAMYEVEVSLLQKQLSITAIASNPDASIAINGIATPSGITSAPIALDSLENPIEVAVTSPGGGTYSYYIALSRKAAAISQAAYGKGSHSGAGDEFGRSIALTGGTLAVGAHIKNHMIMGKDNDVSAADSAAVYVYRQTGTGWDQDTYIQPIISDAGDQFGASVALSHDTLIVGAPGEDGSSTGIEGNEYSNSTNDSGAVYVFKRSSGHWMQEAYIKASDTGRGDRFGSSVALSGDTLAISSPRYDDYFNNDYGSVYIFRRKGRNWVEEDQIKAFFNDDGDLFGTSVALSGNTLAVGAYREDSDATGVGGSEIDNSVVDSGAVFVFRRRGSRWMKDAYIKAFNTDAYDEFGYSVALSGDTLAVGAPLEDSQATGVDGGQNDNSATDSGAVYIYRRRGINWIQEAYIKASNTDAGDRFGSSLSLSGDILAIGAHSEDSGASGIGGDQSNNSANDSGAVYVFQRSDEGWTQKAYIKASNTSVGDSFGANLALSDGTLAVSAHLEDSSANGPDGSQNDDSALDSGAIYMFY